MTCNILLTAVVLAFATVAGLWCFAAIFALPVVFAPFFTVGLFGLTWKTLDCLAAIWTPRVTKS